MHLLPVPAEVPRRREAGAAVGAEEQAGAVAVLTVGLGVRNLRETNWRKMYPTKLSKKKYRFFNKEKCSEIENKEKDHVE